MAEQAQQAAADDAGEGTAEASSGSKKKLFIIIGIVAVVLIGGGVTAFLMMSGGKDSHSEAPAENAGHSGGHDSSANAEGAHENAAEGEHGEAKKEAAAGEHGGGEGHGESSAQPKTTSAAESKPGDVGFGETYPFKSFHLNLGNPLENNYIRLDVSAEYKGGEEQKAELDRRLPQLRDAIVGVVASKSREFLLSPDGKAQLRREIMIRINRYMTQPVENVYITDILIE